MKRLKNHNTPPKIFNNFYLLQLKLQFAHEQILTVNTNSLEVITKMKIDYFKKIIMRYLFLYSFTFSSLLMELYRAILSIRPTYTAQSLSISFSSSREKITEIRGTGISDQHI